MSLLAGQYRDPAAMTVSSQINKSGPYLENGVTTAFPYEFAIQDETHIRVVRAIGGAETILTLGDDYSVTDVGEADGGSVVVSAAASGSTLTLIRNAPFLQELDLENQGAYNAEDVEKAFDLAAQRDQQLQEQISRAVVVPVSAPSTDISALVGGIMALSGNVSEIVAVAAVAAQVNAVVAFEDEIIAVAEVSTSLPAVASVADEIAAVAPHLDDIETVADNIASVVAAAADIPSLAAKLNLDGSNGDAAFFAKLKWLSKAVGEFYEADDGTPGVEIPPQNPADGLGVWVELTAGLTGAGQFNNGKLSGEVVSGSAPLVSATAAITVAGSPMNGQTIRLLNTERRILRPGSPGTPQDDAMQGHFHGATGELSWADSVNRNDGSGGSARYRGSNTITGPITDGVNGAPRIANEHRMKNIGVRVFRRVG